MISAQKNSHFTRFPHGIFSIKNSHFTCCRCPHSANSQFTRTWSKYAFLLTHFTRQNMRAYTQFHIRILPHPIRDTQFTDTLPVGFHVYLIIDSLNQSQASLLQHVTVWLCFESTHYGHSQLGPRAELAGTQVQARVKRGSAGRGEVNVYNAVRFCWGFPTDFNGAANTRTCPAQQYKVQAQLESTPLVPHVARVEMEQ